MFEKAHTPKFVIKKNTNAPISAPEILDKILLIKYFENKPIITTLPQVKSATPWKPINKSVIIKLNIKIGRYRNPNNAGT